MNLKALLASVIIVLSCALVSAPAQQPQPQLQTTPAPAPSGIWVNVLGEVNRPARVALPAGATVLDAVAAAGGMDRSALPRKARLIHKSLSEKPDIVIIDISQILNGEARDVRLRNGDTLFIPAGVF